MIDAAEEPVMANLKERVENLELQIVRLQGEIRTAGQRTSRDWRRTIGAFTDDAGMQQILRDAIRLREADRKRIKSKTSAKSKTRR
jgi:predicted  nucleic acid-binding Zn-ribbon protein